MRFDHYTDDTWGAIKGLFCFLMIPVVLALVLLAARCGAETVRLAWNANPEADLTGYEVAYGTAPGEHGMTLETGTETTADLVGLIPGRTYYVVLRAVVGDLKSPPSEEIVVTIPSKPPAAPSAPTGLRVVEIQTSSNLNEWNTLAYVPSDHKFVRARITTLPAP